MATALSSSLLQMSFISVMTSLPGGFRLLIWRVVGAVEGLIRNIGEIIDEDTGGRETDSRAWADIDGGRSEELPPHAPADNRDRARKDCRWENVGSDQD